MIGTTISHYHVEEKLAEGGMGVLYRARDIRLGRTVAIKVLRPDVVQSEGRRLRFVQEAKAASALNHPNIVTIHDIDRLSEGDQDFIAMEYVKGKPLGEVIGPHGLPIEDAVSYAVQMSDALGVAHQAGIVHRDIKPANVMVTEDGRIKVLDFGLAKLVAPEVVDPEAPTRTGSPRTETGVVVGTPSYMSPEQAVGGPADARSDVFSLGCVLYEMLAGTRPFRGDSLVSTMKAILSEAPRPLTSFRRDVPPDLARIVFRCLEKTPESRFPSARELHQELSAHRSRLAATQVGLKAILRRPAYAVPLILMLLGVGAFGAWRVVEGSRVRWARETALPQIVKLVNQEDIVGALAVAKQARRFIPDDPELRRLWEDIAIPVSIETTPTGADVSMKGYTGGDWELLGKTPIAGIEIPKYSYLRWRVSKAGYETRELAAYPLEGLSVELAAQGTTPAGMVRVPGGEFGPFGAPVARLEDYWLDKYEVTNRQFQAFVDAGGYREQKYWTHPFIENSGVLPWAQAMARFVDTTGRPGPSTWEAGRYQERQEDYPVTGVSWYEAAAYAEFAGKALPTFYHWFRAAGSTGSDASWVSEILNFSNFEGQGPARVGSHDGLAPYGNYDMAGNAREWCWNRTDEERRFILGGAWSERRYMFTQVDARPPFDRSPTNGIRLAKYSTPLRLEDDDAADAPPIARALPKNSTHRNYSTEKAVGDEVFEHFRNLYAYDRTPLNPTVESVDDAYEHWRKETIRLDAAYAGQRVPVYLFLPKNSAPPWQAVVYFPEGDAVSLTSSRDLYLRDLDFIIRSGRAVVYPVYQGTYERRDELQKRGPRSRVDLKIHWSQDLRRSVDYLETRDDIDHAKLAYLGVSMGSFEAPIMLSMDQRFKAAVLVAGGLPMQSTSFPEIDPLNFTPRAHAPLLMLNGRDDFIFPLEISQVPLFRAWGAPAEHKRHVLIESGHIPPRSEIIKEALDWLDRYLGPVQTKTALRR